MHQINTKNKTDCQSISRDVAGHPPAPTSVPPCVCSGTCTSSISHFTFTFNSPWLFAPTPPLPTGANCYDWWQASRLRVTCSSPRRFPAPRRHLQSCQPSRGPGPDRPHWRSCPQHRAKRCRRTDGGISQVSTHSFFLALYHVYLKQNKTKQFFILSNDFCHLTGMQRYWTLGSLVFCFHLYHCRRRWVAACGGSLLVVFQDISQSTEISWSRNTGMLVSALFLIKK